MSKLADSIIHTLVDLVQIPSPSGFTSDVMDWVEGRLEDVPCKKQRTKKGALILTVDGANSDQHRVVTAHVDTLGAMVKEIKSNGRLKLVKVGGWAWNSVEGEYCLIHTGDNGTYTGTILTTISSSHVSGPRLSKEERTQDLMEVRIDAPVNSAQEVRDLGIEVGDFVSFDPRIQVTEQGFVKSRHLDDKASVAILMETIRHLHEKSIVLPYTTHFYIANNEEIGFGGNSNIPEQTVEYLAVDMGAIGEGQATDEYTVSICAHDSSGPYHYGFRKRLTELAKKQGIPYKVDLYPYYSSDASAAMRAGADVLHALIGPGIDASHSFERTHKDSLVATFNLVNAYLLSPIEVL